MTYLKTVNQILRSKLPDRIQLNNQERRRLVKHGLKPDAQIKDLISVASYSTCRKWVRAMEDAPAKRPANGSDFLKRHAAVMWQYDFPCKRKWTIRGMVDLYFLVFIHIEPRRIWISPCTANPTGQWTTQQARNFAMHVEEQGMACEIVRRDNDTKYMETFDTVFTAMGAEIKKTTPESPNLQAFVERVVQTLKHEILNAFCIVSERQLEHTLTVGQSWYNERRGHSGRDNLPPLHRGEDPPTVDLAKHKVVCHSELGGQLRSYRAVA